MKPLLSVSSWCWLWESKSKKKILPTKIFPLTVGSLLLCLQLLSHPKCIAWNTSLFASVFHSHTSGRFLNCGNNYEKFPSVSHLSYNYAFCKKAENLSFLRSKKTKTLAIHVCGGVGQGVSRLRTACLLPWRGISGCLSEQGNVELVREKGAVAPTLFLPEYPAWFQRCPWKFE